MVARAAVEMALNNTPSGDECVESLQSKARTALEAALGNEDDDVYANDQSDPTALEPVVGNNEDATGRAALEVSEKVSLQLEAAVNAQAEAAQRVTDLNKKLDQMLQSRSVSERSPDQRQLPAH